MGALRWDEVTLLSRMGGPFLGRNGAGYDVNLRCVGEEER